MFVAAILCAAAVGFFSGVVAFKVKSRWCPECGATTTDIIARNTQHHL